MQKKRIIMYVYNDITTDARVQRAANALAGNYELTVISTQKGKYVEDKSYKNVFVGGRSSGWKDIIATIFATIRIVRRQHPNIVYCHDYYSAILAFFLVKFHYSGSIVYDAHELIIPEKGHVDNRLKFFFWFEKRIVKKVNLVICASEKRATIMKDHYGLSVLPLVVKNISQLSISTDKVTEEILKSQEAFFRTSGITVVYAGVVTKSRRICELMDAVAALAPKFKLLVVGGGDALVELQEKAKSIEHLTFAFTGSVPYKCLGAILSCCDIGFLYYPVNTLNNKYCASNKIYEYASIGLPMLSNENPTIKVILEDSRIGISQEDFIEGLQKIASKSEMYKKNCIQFSNNNKWEDVADKLVKTINSL